MKTVQTRASENIAGETRASKTLVTKTLAYGTQMLLTQKAVNQKSLHQKPLHRNTRQSGFTLIELVIVIVILGLLAATALSRFLDVTDEAQAAAVEGVGGGFATAVAIAHARWVADLNNQGIPNVLINLEGTVINMNANGWPANTSASGTGAGLTDQTVEECQQIWNALLQSPPSTTTAVGDRGQARYHITKADAPDTCIYELATAPQQNPPSHRIEYNVETGQVFTFVPNLN